MATESSQKSTAEHVIALWALHYGMNGNATNFIEAVAGQLAERDATIAAQRETINNLIKDHSKVTDKLEKTIEKVEKIKADKVEKAEKAADKAAEKAEKAERLDESIVKDDQP